MDKLSGVLCLALLASACSTEGSRRRGSPDGGADASGDAASSDTNAPPCDEGEARCSGPAFQRCVSGSFVTLETCSAGCTPEEGCVERVDECVLGDDAMDAPGPCEESAPPDSFEPDVQWSWMGPADAHYSIVTPLVANLTEDNGDGEINLCDIPDVLVVVTPPILSGGTHGHIYLLDGLTGTEHQRFDTPVNGFMTPALGDIDGDGIVEVIAASIDGEVHAFEHDGTVKWTSASLGSGVGIAALPGAAALADLDNDGDVEIMVGNAVLDHLGAVLFQAGSGPTYSAPTAADLDGDGDLEVILGRTAYQHDGSIYYISSIQEGFPQVADLDMDGLPEVLVMNAAGITLLEHDGTVVYQDRAPGATPGGLTWLRPATIHDFDGDGAPEFAVSNANQYSVYEWDASVVWSAEVLDQSGIAAGTAFDFLGDGTAEAMYADENTMFIFDSTGRPVLESPRTSRTLIEYPVVADIDNDGSAEIVVVSNENLMSVSSSPTVQVIRDVEDRWIQARRIWNQHTYHVTNVREDGTIPQNEPPSWENLNTFRTNAQIEGGRVCSPELI